MIAVVGAVFSFTRAELGALPVPELLEWYDRAEHFAEWKRNRGIY